MKTSFSLMIQRLYFITKSMGMEFLSVGKLLAPTIGVFTLGEKRICFNHPTPV
jgi:hypothetical protein